MENFINLFNDKLPLEISNKILIEFKGMTHPIAKIINQHWEDLNDGYYIYNDYDFIVNNEHTLIDDDVITVTTTKSYQELYLDYPRIYFEPIDGYDFITSLIKEFYG
jgi:hypothetical protein